MGNNLVCSYCSDKNKVCYRIKIERKFFDGPEMWEEYHKKDLLKKYQDVFAIKFEKIFFNEAETYLCEKCFYERFDQNDDWNDYDFPFEWKEKNYNLNIFYQRKGFFDKSALP